MNTGSQSTGQGSPFLRLASALNHAQFAVNRIERLADRLVGPAPTARQCPAPESPGAAPGIDCIFARVDCDARELLAAVDRAHAALARIEEALPEAAT